MTELRYDAEIYRQVQTVTSDEHEAVQLTLPKYVEALIKKINVKKRKIKHIIYLNQRKIKYKTELAQMQNKLLLAE
jgi:hypothetical protein